VPRVCLLITLDFAPEADADSLKLVKAGPLEASTPNLTWLSKEKLDEARKYAETADNIFKHIKPFDLKRKAESQLQETFPAKRYKYN
jgi:hypothetical protein